MPSAVRLCKFCGEDLSNDVPERNLGRHLTGGCIPERWEVELALSALEIENEREQACIRNYWQQMRAQKPGAFICGKDLLRFLGMAVFLLVGLVGLSYGIAIAVSAWFGW